MREILYMYMPGCPHCAKADQILADLRSRDPKYAAVPLRKVDETREKAFADSLDYWYVPCRFVGGRKLLEGPPDEKSIKMVLEAALN